MITFGKHIRERPLNSLAFSKSDWPLPCLFFKGEYLGYFFLTVYVTYLQLLLPIQL